MGRKREKVGERGKGGEESYRIKRLKIEVPHRNDCGERGGGDKMSIGE